ncbi:Uncharacterised protein [Mesomycoplasma conjunctivae]|nr:HNH endonuclease [Mesomycoplasma conjunctivae]VEU66281.1 Uncharacterised protein [Mesomycoplasma conjunctivae]
MSKTTISPEQREEIWKKYFGNEKSGKDFAGRNFKKNQQTWNIDHIIPKALDDKIDWQGLGIEIKDLENLQPVHKNTNKEKKDKTTFEIKTSSKKKEFTIFFNTKFKEEKQKDMNAFLLKVAELDFNTAPGNEHWEKIDNYFLFDKKAEDKSEKSTTTLKNYFDSIMKIENESIFEHHYISLNFLDSNFFKTFQQINLIFKEKKNNFNYNFYKVAENDKLFFTFSLPMLKIEEIFKILYKIHDIDKTNNSIIKFFLWSFKCKNKQDFLDFQIKDFNNQLEEFSRWDFKDEPKHSYVVDQHFYNLLSNEAKFDKINDQWYKFNLESEASNLENK